MSGLIKQIRGWPSEGKTFVDVTPLLLNEEEMNNVVIDFNLELPSHVEGNTEEIFSELFIVTPNTSSHIAHAVAGSGIWPLLSLEREGELPLDTSEQQVIHTPHVSLAVNDSSLNDLINNGRCYAVIMVDVLSSGETVAAIAKFLQDNGFIVIQVASLVDITNKGGVTKLNSLGIENVYSYVHINTEEDDD